MKKKRQGVRARSRPQKENLILETVEAEEKSVSRGLSFGLASGVITTLVMIVGLNSATHLRIAVLGGIISIAVADAFSDAFGIHISEESQNNHREKQIWKETVITFFSKFLVAMSFLIPFLLLPIDTAITVCIIWGLFLITIYSIYLAHIEKKKTFNVVSEHLSIAIIVIIITHFVGDFISIIFT